MSDFLDLFRKGIELSQAELHWEAIDCFKKINELHPRDPILDDVYLNIAICYMHLNLCEEAKDWFMPVYEGKVGDGFFEDGGNNIGSTKARAVLGLVRVNLFLKDFENANSLLRELENDNSGFRVGDTITTFYDVASEEVKVFTKVL